MADYLLSQQSVRVTLKPLYVYDAPGAGGKSGSNAEPLHLPIPAIAAIKAVPGVVEVASDYIIVEARSTAELFLVLARAEQGIRIALSRWNVRPV
jgi:hypothetical protein